MVRMRSPVARYVFMAIAALSFAAPILAVPVIGLAALGQLCLGLLHLAAFAAFPVRVTAARTPSTKPEVRFSVHIAAHDEPTALVRRTLLSLARQSDAPEFEVIVLDNNTADPALWRPVEALCRALGPGFRFHHEENLIGAKAGALNLALARTCDAATHIVVIDADYELAPDFLALAARTLREVDADFLQFPQAYRNEAGPAAGLALELADYFQRHARQANGADAMLLTGTLSVIAREALARAGGWSAATITEDAELGLRLRRLGYHGRLVDRVMGRGILPLDLEGLERQRHRWAAGNVGAMLDGRMLSRREPGASEGLPLRTRVHLASQLTAWANFALPLTAGLIGGGAALALGLGSPGLETLMLLAATGLILVYLSTLAPLIRTAFVRGAVDARTVCAAVAIRIAMMRPSAEGTVDALLGSAGEFRRTPKDAAQAGDAWPRTSAALAACGLALLASPSLAPLARIAALLLILPFPFALFTQGRLVAYRASLRSSQEAA